MNRTAAVFLGLAVLLLCGRSGFITVGLSRDPDPWDKPAAVAVAWPGTEINLRSGRSPPPVPPGAATKEMWVASTPKVLLENATFGDSIELLDTPAGTGVVPPRRTALSATGLASLIGTLAQRCP